MKLTKSQRGFIGTEFITPKGGIIKIIGYYGKTEKGGKSLFSCVCSICSKDKELYPEPFKSVKSSFYDNQFPCGCAKIPKWSEEQYKILIKRKCEELKYTFNGLIEPYSGCGTKIDLYNPYTGNRWDTTSISKFLTCESKDPALIPSITKNLNLKPDDYHIAEFYATQAFKSGTSFKRNLTRKSKDNCYKYWDVTCGYCKERNTSSTSNLKQGKVPCSCSSGGFDKNKTTTFYIVRWFGFGHSWLKFGITNRSVIDRTKEQEYKSKLDNVKVFEVTEGDGHRLARIESELKRVMDTHRCPKKWLPDGYTETVDDTDFNLSFIKRRLGF